MRSNRLLVLGVVLPLLSAVAACGGGNPGDNPINPSNPIDPNDPKNPIEPGAPTFPYKVNLPEGAELAALPAKGQALVAQFRDRNQGFPSDAGTLMGSATYSGTVGMTIDSGPEGEAGAALIGDIGLTANFNDNNVTGVLNNFTVVSDDVSGPVTGSLAFNNGAVADSGFVAKNGLTGTLTDPTNDDYIFAGTIEGTFLTAGGGQVIGDIDGKVTNPDNSSDDFGGLFSADKN